MALLGSRSRRAWSKYSDWVGAIKIRNFNHRPDLPALVRRDRGGVVCGGGWYLKNETGRGHPSPMKMIPAESKTVDSWRVPLVNELMKLARQFVYVF